jgi:predicted transcriptional regulator
MERTKTMLGLRVGPETLADIDALSKAMNRSRAWIGEEALRQYCLIQKWQLKEIAASFTESEAGGPVIQNEDIVAWLSSWGKPNEKSAPQA